MFLRVVAHGVAGHRTCLEYGESVNDINGLGCYIMDVDERLRT